MRTLVFGDSIVYGAMDEHGGWVDRLKRVRSKEGFMNLGIGGDTTTGLLMRMSNEVFPRQKADLRIILSIGTNDSRINHRVADMETTEFEFRANIVKLIELAKGNSNNVVLVSMLPVAADDMHFTAPNGEEYTYNMETIQKRNAFMQKIAAELKVEYIDLFSDFYEHRQQLLDGDGLHPNTDGHAWIASQINAWLDGHPMKDSSPKK